MSELMPWSEVQLYVHPSDILKVYDMYSRYKYTMEKYPEYFTFKVLKDGPSDIEFETICNPDKLDLINETIRNCVVGGEN